MSKVPLNNTNDPNKEKSGSWLISRRAFLGISATTAAALTAAYAIDWPGIDFGADPMDSTEGVLEEKWVMTSCLNCPTRCAIKVRVVNDEKVVRIIGNSNSTYSDGKTCPRAHIGLQVLYNPDRITKPLRRTASSKGKDVDPEWEEIEWGDALIDILVKMNGLSADKLLLIQGLNTTSNEDLINRFAKSIGTTNLLREDLMEREADRAGKKLADGNDNSGYDLENANYVLSFGADIIESEVPLSRNLRLWGKIRQERASKARVVVINPRYSVTASKADEWIPINPGTEGALAMSIAHVIVTENLYNTDFTGGTHVTNFDAYKTEVSRGKYDPRNISDITGIDADVIRRIAREFAEVKPAIAWSGAAATSWPHGTYASYAIYCLNALVGNIDIPGGIIYQEMPEYQAMPAIAGTDPGISLKDAKDGLGNIDIAIGFNNNLIMSVPDADTWDKALSNIPYYIHIASAETEMAQYADIILPSCTYLEEYAYESAPPGSGYAEAKIKQPVIEAFGDSKPTAEIIFDLVEQLGGNTATNFNAANIGSNAEGFVRFRTNFVNWNTFKTDGVWKGADYQYAEDNAAKYDDIFKNTEKKFKFVPENLSELLTPELQGSESEYPFKLATYHPVMNVRNGNQNYPWAQEIFLVMHGRGWNNFLEINKHDADEIGIKDGDEVRVKSSSGVVTVKARVFEGIIPGTVAIATGQGHYACGEWADGIGANPNEVISIDYDEESGQASFANTRVEIEKA